MATADKENKQNDPYIIAKFMKPMFPYPNSCMIKGVILWHVMKEVNIMKNAKVSKSTLSRF